MLRLFPMIAVAALGAALLGAFPPWPPPLSGLAGVQAHPHTLGDWETLLATWHDAPPARMHQR